MHYLHVLLLRISQLGSRGERSGLRRLEPNRLLLMLSEQAGHQLRYRGLLVQVAMHLQVHRFRGVRQREADDCFAAAQGLLLRGEPGLDHPLFQQGCEVIGVADAGAANGPDPCEVLR